MKMDERMSLRGKNNNDDDVEFFDIVGDWISAAAHSLAHVEVVGRIKTLTILFLHENSLTEMPHGMENLPNLVDLYVIDKDFF